MTQLRAYLLACRDPLIASSCDDGKFELSRRSSQTAGWFSLQTTYVGGRIERVGGRTVLTWQAQLRTVRVLVLVAQMLITIALLATVLAILGTYGLIWLAVSALVAEIG